MTIRNARRVLRLLLVAAAAWLPVARAGEATAYFAAGCFWSVELAFQRTPGVSRTAVGYIGGHTESPTYKQVVTQQTGHAEAVEVTFDDTKITYADLLDIFFEIHDPTQLNRQGNDVGTSYRSLIAAERGSAHWDLAARMLGDSMSHAVTQLLPLDENKFWPAELYHQQYLEKGGQSSRKGSLLPIHCYGTDRRGPVKTLTKKRKLMRIFSRSTTGAESDGL
eukprot:g2426.t1